MKPLTKRQRSISMIILGILFVLSAPIIVLYSLGYTLDESFSIQKTGGIFIHSTISSANIYVDREFFKTNGIFNRNTLIQDLVPNKKYFIEIHKEGYQSWIKEIYVYPSLVSEGTVFMLPKEFEIRPILKFVDSEGISTSTPPIKGQIKSNNSEYLSTLDLFASTTISIIEKPLISNATTTASTSKTEQKSVLEIFFDELGIKNYDKLKNLVVDGEEISWLENGNIQLYWIDDFTNIPYYYCDGEEERICTKKITLDWNDEIKRFNYLPGKNYAWIVLTQNGIFAVDIDGRTARNIQTIYLGENLDFRLTQSDRLIIKKGSEFFEINL